MASIFSAVDGTLLNALTVLIGGVLGTWLGDRLPRRTQESLFGVLGLFTVLVGLIDAFTTKNVLILLGALLLGTLLGEWADLEGRLNRFGDAIQRRLVHRSSASAPPVAVPAHDGPHIGPRSRMETVSEAFVTSSLVFCVGPLSILGALDNGLTGDFTKLAIKATLDGFAALAFSAALGPGVLLSIAVILLYQGALSLGAHAIAPLLRHDTQAITELTATGGLVLVAIGLKLLNIRDLRVANLLPALPLAPLLLVIVPLIAHSPLLHLP